MLPSLVRSRGRPRPSPTSAASIGMVLDQGFVPGGRAVYFEVANFPTVRPDQPLLADGMLAFAERGGQRRGPEQAGPARLRAVRRRFPTSRRESLWGPGRPGWYIECSALCLREARHDHRPARRGSDLIFPHHECEAAQSEAATGEPLVRHWMHQAMVRMDGEKMSKSLGNLVFVPDPSQSWDPRAIRPPRVAPLPERPGSGPTG